jgi:hypothetical protein
VVGAALERGCLKSCSQTRQPAEESKGAAETCCLTCSAFESDSRRRLGS